MFWASVWKRDDKIRIYLNARSQEARIWLEQGEDDGFVVRYTLFRREKGRMHHEFAVPLALNNNNREPRSLACRTFELWQEQEGVDFKTWDGLLAYCETSEALRRARK